MTELKKCIEVLKNYTGKCGAIEEIIQLSSQEMNAILYLLKLAQLFIQVSESGVKKYDDYPRCCVAGHTIDNCQNNIISKAKFEEHNKMVDIFNALLTIKLAGIEEVIEEQIGACGKEVVEQLTQAIKTKLTEG